MCDLVSFLPICNLCLFHLEGTLDKAKFLNFGKYQYVIVLFTAHPAGIYKTQPQNTIIQTLLK